MSRMTRLGSEPVWAPDGAGAAAVADGGAAAPAPAPAAEGGAAAPAAAAPWYDALEPDVRTVLVNAGWHKGDPLAAAAAAAKGYDHAQRMLGHGPANLVRKPEAGKLDEWLGAHAELLGVPGKAEEYAIPKPADLPEGVVWDDALAKKAAALGFEAKIPPAQMERMARLYADHISETLGAVERETKLAKAEMESALSRDWGAQKGERVALAARAFDHVAEAAGLAPEVRGVISRAMVDALDGAGLKGSAGDVALVKMFAAIGQMMAEDTFRSDGLGAGNGGPASSAAAAQARIDEIIAPGGAYAQAQKAGDQHKAQALLAEITSLSAVAAKASPRR